MRTRGRALLLIGALVLSLGADASAQSRSIRIRKFDALLSVHADGSLDVTEQITIGFTGQWNGINRDLSRQHNTAQGRATKLDVTVGASSVSEVEIRSGLKEGEKVIVSDYSDFQGAKNILVR